MAEKELYCYIQAKRKYKQIKERIKEAESVIGKPEETTSKEIQSLYRTLYKELAESERNVFTTYDYLLTLEEYFTPSEWEIFKLRYIEGLNRLTISEKTFYSETTITRKIKSIKQKILAIA